jgi:hypothetical protein
LSARLLDRATELHISYCKETDRMEPSERNSTWFYKVAAFVLFFVVASAVSSSHLDNSAIGSESSLDVIHDPRGFAAMVDGTAERPFVYRRLVPEILNAMNALVPAKVQDKLFELHSKEGVREVEKYSASPLSASRVYFLRFYSEMYLDVGFIFVGLLLAYRLGLHFGYSRPIALLAAISVFLVTAYFGAGYIYDYPELAWMLLAVWAAAKLDWWWLLPITALATYNKESFLFYLVTLYPFLRSRTSTKLATFRLASLMLVSGLVNVYVHYRYRLNPGSVMELHLGAQLRSLMYLFVPQAMHKTYGLVLPSNANIVSIVLFGWFAHRGWRLLSRTQRRHTLTAAVINFPLYFLFCVPGELRNLSMLYISILFLMLANLEAWQRSLGPQYAVQNMDHVKKADIVRRQTSVESR